MPRTRRRNTCTHRHTRLSLHRSIFEVVFFVVIFTTMYSVTRYGIAIITFRGTIHFDIIISPVQKIHVQRNLLNSESGKFAVHIGRRTACTCDNCYVIRAPIAHYERFFETAFECARCILVVYRNRRTGGDVFRGPRTLRKRDSLEIRRSRCRSVSCWTHETSIDPIGESIFIICLFFSTLEKTCDLRQSREIVLASLPGTLS